MARSIHHRTTQELAYGLWEREGRPHGRDLDHWERAIAMRQSQGVGSDDPFTGDAEAVIDGNPDADFPALLTKDVNGG